MIFNKNTRLCISLSARPSDFGIRFHNHLYEELGLNFLYKSFACSSTDAFDDAIRAMKALGIRGCGISMPFKEHALKWAEELEPSARRIGAINTLVNDGGKLVGYNKDYAAVRELLEKATMPRDASVVLLGSGGMARAIACAVQDLGFKNAVLVSRNPETGQRLARDFGFRWMENFPAGGAEILINATPIGMKPQDRPEDPRPFTDEQIAQAQLIVDSVASPPESALIRLAREAGKTVISGYEIVTLQAVAQFELYTGARPSPKQVSDAGEFARLPRSF